MTESDESEYESSEMDVFDGIKNSNNDDDIVTSQQNKSNDLNVNSSKSTINVTHIKGIKLETLFATKKDITTYSDNLGHQIVSAFFHYEPKTKLLFVPVKLRSDPIQAGLLIYIWNGIYFQYQSKYMFPIPTPSYVTNITQYWVRNEAENEYYYGIQVRGSFQNNYYIIETRKSITIFDINKINVSNDKNPENGLIFHYFVDKQHEFIIFSCIMDDTIFYFINGKTSLIEMRSININAKEIIDVLKFNKTIQLSLNTREMFNLRTNVHNQGITFYHYKYICTLKKGIKKNKQILGCLVECFNCFKYQTDTVLLITIENDVSNFKELNANWISYKAYINIDKLNKNNKYSVSKIDLINFGYHYTQYKNIQLSNDERYMLINNKMYDLTAINSCLNNKILYAPVYMYIMDNHNQTILFDNKTNDIEMIESSGRNFIHIKHIDFGDKKNGLIKIIWENIRKYLSTDDCIQIIMEYLGLASINIKRRDIINTYKYQLISKITNNPNNNDNNNDRIYILGKKKFTNQIILQQKILVNID